MSCDSIEGPSRAGRCRLQICGGVARATPPVPHMIEAVNNSVHYWLRADKSVRRSSRARRFRQLQRDALSREGFESLHGFK